MYRVKSLVTDRGAWYVCVMSTYGDVIRQARIKAGMTQKELAGVIGQRSQYLADIENGHRDPLDTLRSRQLAKALNIPVIELQEIAVRKRGEINVRGLAPEAVRALLEAEGRLREASGG